MRLAVIGDPVAHSASPRLQQRFLDKAGIDGTYATVTVTRGGGVAAIARLRDDGFTGCNVTYPLKEEAFMACDAVSEESRKTRSVNTIFFGARMLGTTTDGIGARAALESLLDQPIALKRIGVLGYGSTARAILLELGDNDAYTFVWGRNPERVRDVCRDFEARAWPEANPPEIVVSTLPPGAQPPPRLIDDLRRADLVMDANYGARATLGALLRRDVVPGDAMLEAQARASFDYWLAHVDALDK